MYGTQESADCLLALSNSTTNHVGGFQEPISGTICTTKGAVSVPHNAS